MPVFGTSPKLFGGFAIDRGHFRSRLPDLRWVVRAAGIVDSGANTAIIALVYVDDSLGMTPISGATGGFATGTPQKFTLGPALLFDPADGYPTNETVPIVRLLCSMDVGIGHIEQATIWVEQFSSRS